jgi:hypothetical protein
LFATPTIVLTAAAPHATEVESQGPNTVGYHRPGHGDNHAIVHVATPQRMRVTDDCRRPLAGSLQEVERTFKLDGTGTCAGQGDGSQLLHISILQRSQSIPEEIGHGDAAASLPLLAGAVGGDQGMAAQLLPDSLAQGASPLTMDDPHQGQARQKSIIEVLVQAQECIFHSVTPQVQFDAGRGPKAGWTCRGLGFRGSARAAPLQFGALHTNAKAADLHFSAVAIQRSNLPCGVEPCDPHRVADRKLA